MISVGIHYGGPELKDTVVTKTLERVLVVAARERRPNYNDGNESWINPIFLVPGSVSKPDFAGIDRGHFSRKRKGLLLKIAVPESVVDGDGLSEFVVAALRDCVRIASEHFAAKGLSFSTLGAEKIIREIERAIAPS